MSKITITEALQEIKTIGKRLEKKRNACITYLARDSRVRDPLEKDGGSEKFITTERQAIGDLENRVISIRTAIQSSNLNSKVTVGDTTRSVAEWLTWRREVSANQVNFLRSVVQGISNLRNEVQKKGGKVVTPASAGSEVLSPNDPPQLIVHMDEKGLVDQQEQLEQVLGDLDGKLSLFNATTTIEV